MKKTIRESNIGYKINKVTITASRKGSWVEDMFDPFHSGGEIVEVRESHNLVVTAGKGLAAKMLCSTSDYDDYRAGLTYCAIGTGTTTPTASNTALVTEVARKAITSASVSGAVATISTFLLASECTYDIQEAGWFGYPATATLDTGTLFNRALLDYDNSAGNVDLTIDLEATVS